jgi:hypothetical protein
VLGLAHALVARLFADWTSWRDESTLAVLVLIGGAFYGAAIFALFGKKWLTKPPPPPTPPD